jgi:biopolymer transport protein ExbB
MIVFLAAFGTATMMPLLQTIVGAGPAAHAQADEAVAEEDIETRTVLDDIIAGGIPELVIILMSVVGIALTIEHFVTIRRDKLVPPYLLNELENLFEEEEFEEAMDLCDREDNFLCKVVGAGLNKMGAGYDRMVMSVSAAAEEEATILYQKISWLSLIGSLAPMVGLLGTVIGMMASFRVIAVSRGMAQPHMLADGIQQALVTTCSGLIVAIPVLASYTIFRNRVVRVVQEVESLTNELIDKFRPVE